MSENRLNNFIFPALVFIIAAMILVVSIFEYTSSRLKEEDLIYREYTFLRYSYVSHVKGGSHYEFYVNEEDVPFYMSVNVYSITDQTILEKAQNGDKCALWVNNFNICAGTLNGETFLSFEDFQRRSGSDGIIGIVVGSVLAIASLGLTIAICVGTKKRKEQ